jgi:hypothetical protein
MEQLSLPTLCAKRERMKNVAKKLVDKNDEF